MPPPAWMRNLPGAPNAPINYTAPAPFDESREEHARAATAPRIRRPLGDQNALWEQVQEEAQRHNKHNKHNKHGKRDRSNTPDQTATQQQPLPQDVSMALSMQRAPRRPSVDAEVASDGNPNPSLSRLQLSSLVARPYATVSATRPVPPPPHPPSPTPPSSSHPITLSCHPNYDMGATKRLSNGEAKAPPTGPQSSIRVSAPYMSQAAIERRLQPATLDVQERSQAEAREDSIRLQGATWLNNVQRFMQLPIRTFTTACFYYHKFRMAHPTVEYSWADAVAASLLVACKNEDTLKKSRDILAAAYNMKQPAGHEHIGSDDPMLDASSRLVIGLERLVLESGGFDFRSRSPHDVLVKISKSLPRNSELKNVVKLAWTILTDLHRTFAPLKQSSATLALACLELAAHLTAATSPDSTCSVLEDLQNFEVGKWSSTREEIMETLLDALDMYTHHPSATILGSKYSLDDMLRIRLALNKECTETGLPRYTIVQPPPSPDHTNGTRVSNGHPTPVSPPQPGGQVLQPQSSGFGTNLAPPDGSGTLRFMLNPTRSTEERAETNRYYTDEWEEYEEEIEVPIPRSLSRDRERDRDRRRDYSRDYSDRPPREREDRYDDRRSTRDSRENLRGTALERDREREAERERARMRDRDRERRYDERRYDDRERERRRFDDRKDRDRERDRDGRRYYEDDRRRVRDDRR